MKKICQFRVQIPYPVKISFKNEEEILSHLNKTWSGLEEQSKEFSSGWKKMKAEGNSELHRKMKIAKTDKYLGKYKTLFQLL